MIASYIFASTTPDIFICYDIELLLQQLQRNDAVERQHARETLGKVGKQVVPPSHRIAGSSAIETCFGGRRAKRWRK